MLFGSGEEQCDLELQLRSGKERRKEIGMRRDEERMTPAVVRTGAVRNMFFNVAQCPTRKHLTNAI